MCNVLMQSITQRLFKLLCGTHIEVCGEQYLHPTVIFGTTAEGSCSVKNPALKTRVQSDPVFFVLPILAAQIPRCKQAQSLHLKCWVASPLVSWRGTWNPLQPT